MLLIDTDPGLDDAHALAIAARHASSDLVVTTVAGNASLATVTDNAAWLLAILAPDARLHRGAAAPLHGDRVDAEHIHGGDGLAGFPRSQSRVAVRPEPAAVAIADAARTHGTDLNLVALGPLTNLAVALALEPRLPELVGRVTIMGGSPAGHGNASLNAEYNVYADPVAAETVLRHFPRVTLVTWDLSLSHRFTSAEIDSCFASGTPGAELLGSIERHRRAHDADFAARTSYGRADGLAMAVALDDSCVRDASSFPVHVGVGGLAHGLTSVDRRHRPDDARPRVRIIDELHHDTTLRLLTL